MSDGTSVSFTMTGPSGGRLPSQGGEYIGDSDTTPTQYSASTVSGDAVVILHSGKVAGPVTVVATVTIGTNTLSSSSSTVSIGGGVPNDIHFTLASDVFNLPGLFYTNRQANISAYVGDRFGNYNVLENTTISFYAESGAIDRNSLLDATGATSVVFRTQNPAPGDVVPTATENALCSYLATTYAISVYSGTACSAGHPRNGWASITASVNGEEAFIDSNGNGMYDGGEPFTDTAQEAFVDVNDSGAWNDGPNYPGPDQRELYIDDNNNSLYDGADGVWDSSKTIFEGITLLITGQPSYMELYNSTDGTNSVGTILPASSKCYKVLVADQNLNPLSPGTTIAISSDGGTLNGTTSETLPDILPSEWTLPSTEYTFCISSGVAAGCDTATPPTCTQAPLFVTVDVTWEGVKYERIYSGQIYK